MASFAVDTIGAFDATTKAALTRGLGEFRSGVFCSGTLPMPHCIGVIAARAQRLGLQLFALRGKLVIQRRGHATPMQLARSCPILGNQWVTGLPVTAGNTLAAALRVAS